jgi:hypothetical protein
LQARKASRVAASGWWARAWINNRYKSKRASSIQDKTRAATTPKETLFHTKMSASLSCPVTWAQRKDSLFVTLAIPDVDAKTAKVSACRVAARRACATCRSLARARPRRWPHAPLAPRLARSRAGGADGRQAHL